MHYIVNEINYTKSINLDLTDCQECVDEYIKRHDTLTEIKLV